MKRLCVFYYTADSWFGKKIEWIICKECQKKLKRGYTYENRLLTLNAPKAAFPHSWNDYNFSGRFRKSSI
jgi:hypothetical protein